MLKYNVQGCPSSLLRQVPLCSENHLPNLLRAEDQNYEWILTGLVLFASQPEKSQNIVKNAKKIKVINWKMYISEINLQQKHFWWLDHEIPLKYFQKMNSKLLAKLDRWWEMRAKSGAKTTNASRSKRWTKWLNLAKRIFCRFFLVAKCQW